MLSSHAYHKRHVSRHALLSTPPRARKHRRPVLKFKIYKKETKKEEKEEEPKEAEPKKKPEPKKKGEEKKEEKKK